MVTAQPLSQIRLMHTLDLPKVHSIEVASYDFPWTVGMFADCLRTDYRCFVLCQGEVIVGYVILWMSAFEVHVLNLCIATRWRGQGLGRELLQHALDIAGGHHARQILLEVRPSNTVAHALYAAMGFREIGRRPRYYPARDGREDAVVMARVYDLS